MKEFILQTLNFLGIRIAFYIVAFDMNFIDEKINRAKKETSINEDNLFPNNNNLSSSALEILNNARLNQLLDGTVIISGRIADLTEAEQNN